MEFVYPFDDLNEARQPLTTTKGQIYKISVTLRDSLEHRLKRELTCKRDSFIPVQIMISDILI